MNILASDIKEFWQVLVSVAASMFGVQSHQNYQRDFQKHSFVPFLMVGILFVAVLVLLLVWVVNLATA